jgi:hypothetical protein
VNPGLICPKCGAEMRSYERNGVTIDQCTGCRGVFLDRGELERLVDAESAFYGQRRESSDRESSDRERSDRERSDRERSHRDHDDDWSRRQQGYSSGHKKKRSFLDELFD